MLGLNNFFFLDPAREVVETGGKLNWFLDKVSKTPSKVPDESAALLNVEFPDDESDQ